MAITIVISTANSRIDKISIPEADKDIKYIVVHQVFESPEDQFLLPGDILNRGDVFYYKLNFKGLSKSRNFGLLLVDTKHAYIMDDDVEFNIENIKLMAAAMIEQRAHVATCQHVFESGQKKKIYKNHPFVHSMYSLAKVSSIDIMVDVEIIKSKKIFFDDRFGLGTDLPSGEEYIFLTDCLKSGLKVMYFPIEVGVHPDAVSGVDFYSSENRILAKREMLKRVFGRRALFFIFLFWLKKLPEVYAKGRLLIYSKIMFLGNR